MVKMMCEGRALTVQTCTVSALTNIRKALGPLSKIWKAKIERHLICVLEKNLLAQVGNRLGRSLSCLRATQNCVSQHC